MDYSTILAKGVQKKRQTEAETKAQVDQATKAETKANFQSVVQGVNEANQNLVKFLLNHSPEVSVKNFPAFPKPDNSDVVKAIKQISIPDSGSDIVNAVTELINQNKAILEAFKTLDFTPEVKVAAPKVQVDAPNFDPVVEAIRESKPDPVKINFKTLTDRLDAQATQLDTLTEAINELPHRMPKTHVDVDPLITFLPVDIDDAGLVQYFGYTRSGDGAWYIRQYDTSGSPKTIRFYFGSGAYNFADRATYAYIIWGQ